MEDTHLSTRMFSVALEGPRGSNSTYFVIMSTRPVVGVRASQYDETLAVRASTGETGVIHVHKREHCKGERCAIHKPTRHELRHMELVWNEHRRQIMRRCPHGAFHPDPDQIDWYIHLGYQEPDGRIGALIHQCDGCCSVQS